MTEIKFKCKECDFSFTDKNLIFYLESELNDLDSILNSDSKDLKFLELPLNKESSDKMNKALISGFLYENYCPHCKKLIKTYVPERNELFTQEEIEKILTKEISNSFNEDNDNADKDNENTKNYQEKEENFFKILFFDFEKTLYRDRRNILENNTCPNCNEKMSLLISEKVTCPKCGSSLKEEF